MTLFYYTAMCLKVHGKTLNDIQWIGNSDFTISIEDFINHSKKIEMNTGDYIPLSSLPNDLLIVGNDFWLSRPSISNDELEDLSDIWSFNTMPNKPLKEKKLRTLTAEFLSGNEEWIEYRVELNMLTQNENT